MAMARAGSLFHTPDVGIYLRAIDWRTWGENVGYTPGDVGSVHEAFMASPTHRETSLTVHSDGWRSGRCVWTARCG